MDGGYRPPRPVERRVAHRTEATTRQEQPAQEPPKQVQHPATPRHAAKKDKPRGKRLWWLIVVAAIAVAGVVGWFMWSSRGGGMVAIDSSKYQAVFFTNGQVYFGKLQSANDEYLKLTDIYYLQSQQSGSDSNNPQSTSNDQNTGNVQLIKLGDEIHGPEDAMIISKEQVLFYENLKTDGKVAQSIQKFKDAE